MVLFPRRDKIYWYVTDVWEVFVVVPVRVQYNRVVAAPARFKIKLVFMEHPDRIATRRELYRTRKQAAHVADKMNRKANE